MSTKTKTTTETETETTTEKIINPFESTVQGIQHPGSDETMDATWAKEVDSAAAAAVQKRNSAPPGTYITDPAEYEPIVTTGLEDEKNKAGDVIGQRLIATIIVRGTARVKDANGDRKDVTQILRFRLSPESRFKKVYEGNQWTGEVDQNKDDMATRLWANAVSAFEEQNGKGNGVRGTDLLTYLKTVPIALRAMQGDRGELIVLQIQNRGRRNRG